MMDSLNTRSAGLWAELFDVLPQYLPIRTRSERVVLSLHWKTRQNGVLGTVSFFDLGLTEVR